MGLRRERIKRRAEAADTSERSIQRAAKAVSWMAAIYGEMADGSRCAAQGCRMRDASSRQLDEVARRKTGATVEAQCNAGRGSGLWCRWV